MLDERRAHVGAEGGLHGWLEKENTTCLEVGHVGEPMHQFTAEPDKGHRRMLCEFIREINGEREPVRPVKDAILATRICMAAATSYLERRVVPISEVPGDVAN